jgi:hypothetical protein
MEVICHLSHIFGFHRGADGAQMYSFCSFKVLLSKKNIVRGVEDSLFSTSVSVPKRG